MARAAHIVARAPRVEWHARRAHIGVLTFGVEQHGRPSVLSLPAQAELLTLNHEQHLNYEFSHILMFSTAIVYAKVRARDRVGVRDRVRPPSSTPRRASSSRH